ncbi:hypothetical protein Pcinc_034289 [Petrolisthes cinctipes]|uniref:Uncharacterized protein n=1 Tax=Petrolisthes cinctipes TaxID=88211 RepID=A0AAE1EQJ3_PETCI|nr:hypothetical protein Pcinc_034289 [Petrolisthes cinctipes]
MKGGGNVGVGVGGGLLGNMGGGGGVGGGLGGGGLSVPNWESARRPSFLPNDTQMNLRPKVRRLSTYDLSINTSDASTADTPVVMCEGEVDLEDPEPPPCLNELTEWVMGDVQYMTDFLDGWPLFSRVLPLKLLNAVLRNLGAPILANNPISGLLILTALLFEAPMVMVWAAGALGVALLMSLVLQQPQHIVSSGQVTQHGLLLGILVGHSLVKFPHTTITSTAITLTLSAALSVLVGNAVSTWLSQTNLPGLTVAYTVLGSYLCSGLGYHDFSSSVAGHHFPNATLNQELQWSLVLQGAVLGAGQVYGCSTLVSSGLVLAAMLVFSPITFFQAVLGSLTGSLCGTVMDQPPFTALYSGLYCRHSLLSCLSLAGFFFTLNLYSTLTGVCGAVFSSFIFHTLNKNSFPVLTTPHVVATLVLLHARIRGGLLKRVDLIYLTYPEMHRRLFRPGNAVEDCALP